MLKESGDLIIEDNNYTTKHRKRFHAYATMLEEDKIKSFNFAYGMSYGDEGEHRDSRSGGSEHRTKGQIFINTFQGKMAEFAIYRYLLGKNISLLEPDTSEFDLGKWDSFDLVCQNKYLAIKSTISYGDLLLLETKDWNENAEYIPNIGNGISKYDYTILVRFSPDGKKIMDDNNILKQEDSEIAPNIREILIENIRDINWQYDFPGFIYYNEVKKMIQDKRIIPKNAKLNKKIPMDAENYYFQSGNMHSISELYKGPIDDMDEEVPILLRTCPNCGGTLVKRTNSGNHNVFWGCSNYGSSKCTFTENY